MTRAAPRTPEAATFLRTVFPGDSVMARRCRAFDWGATPLGPVESWSVPLRTTTGIVLTSCQPMLLLWSPALVHIYNDPFSVSLGTTGRARHALGVRARDFWTDIWDTIAPQFEQVMSGGPSIWQEDLLLPIERDGRLEDVWWTYSYSPVREEDGSIAAILVVCQETTRRVIADRERDAANAALAAERAQLAAIVDQAPAFMAVLRGPEHRFERVNSQYERLVGGRPLVGRTVADAVPEVVDQGFIELLDRVLRTGEPYVGRSVPVRLARAPGQPLEERCVDFVYQALTEADGTRSGVFVHGVDVTEAVLDRREVERLLAESERARHEAEVARRDAESARRAAEEASRAKGDFLAVMSHELRTPLNAIGGYTNLIDMGLHGPVTPEQHAALDRIQRSQRALLSLINEVLNYTRLETGTVTYDVTDVVVADAIASAEVLVAPQIRTRGLVYRAATCPPGLVVRADRDKLQQILLNLLSNAIKFTEPRDGEAGEVEIVCDTDARGRVRIKVRDTGVGIPRDKVESIFDPFVQVRSDLTRPHEGTGLGLAISRDLAHGMRGELTVESTPGEGSTFTLVLPQA